MAWYARKVREAGPEAAPEAPPSPPPEGIVERIQSLVDPASGWTEWHGHPPEDVGNLYPGERVQTADGFWWRGKDGRVWFKSSAPEEAFARGPTENPRRSATDQRTIVLAWTEDESEFYGPEARVDLGQRHAIRAIRVPYAALWKATGTEADVVKAKKHADSQNANAGLVKYHVFTYPTTDRDWKEPAKRDVLKATGQ
jgi:hypothetical protein